MQVLSDLSDMPNGIFKHELRLFDGRTLEVEVAEYSGGRVTVYAGAFADISVEEPYYENEVEVPRP